MVGVPLAGNLAAGTPMMVLPLAGTPMMVLPLAGTLAGAAQPILSYAYLYASF